MVSVKVVFDYDAEQPDELTLKVGDIIKNVDQQDGGWWEGELNGKVGMFPENFVEVMAKPADAPLPPLPTEKTSSGSDVKFKVRVTFEYEPTQEDELELKVGDIVDVFDDEEEGWWNGRLNGKSGVFPSNFVEVIKEEERPPPSLPPEPGPAETESKKERPRSQIGFALRPEDLAKKLKKTNNKPKEDHSSAEANKPIQKVLPLEPKSPTNEIPIDKKLPPLPPPAVAATKTVQKARVTFAYDPEQDDELKLSVGDVILITNTEVFEGWMEGELHGRRGLFPNNFVELLPIETVKIDSNQEMAKPMSSKKSVKRAAKENPSNSRTSSISEKPTSKPMGNSLFPGGGSSIKAELEKRIGFGKPPSIKSSSNKGPAPPPPAAKPKPGSKPKPPAPAAHSKPDISHKPQKPLPPKAEEPEQKKSGFPLRTSSVSSQQDQKNEFPVPRTFTGSNFRKPSLDKPVVNHTDSPKKPTPPSVEIAPAENSELDLDTIKPTDPLKHMSRAKPPTKNPPSKYKDKNGSFKDSGVSDKEITELRTEVSELRDKMSEMQRKFELLLKQVQGDLDEERKARLSQQVEIDRLKKNLALQM